MLKFIVKALNADLENEFFDFYAPTVQPSYFTESVNNYSIAVEVPGFEGDEISIEHSDDTLRVSASSKYRKLFKTWFVPNADPEKITAKLKNGILSIDVPKKEIPIRKIQVQID